MRVVSRKKLREFSAKHADAKAPLDAWYAEAKQASWTSFADVKAAYRSADVVAGNRVIFNIGGNKYRLVVKVAYRLQQLFVLFIGTHAEYMKIDVATVTHRKH